MRDLAKDYSYNSTLGRIRDNDKHIKKNKRSTKQEQNKNRKRTLREQNKNSQ